LVVPETEHQRATKMIHNVIPPNQTETRVIAAASIAYEHGCGQLEVGEYLLFEMDWTVQTGDLHRN